jgi:hypothetical protein
MDDINYTDFDPGIRETVRLLRSCGIPNKSYRLMMLLQRAGIDFFSADPTDGPWIEASYSPIDGVAVIMLTNVDDEMLRQARAKECQP